MRIKHGMVSGMQLRIATGIGKSKLVQKSYDLARGQVSLLSKGSLFSSLTSIGEKCQAHNATANGHGGIGIQHSSRVIISEFSNLFLLAYSS